MTESQEKVVRRRNAITLQERRERLEATHEIAMMTIEAEAAARRKKTERLRAEREASTQR